MHATSCNRADMAGGLLGLGHLKHLRVRRGLRLGSAILGCLSTVFFVNIRALICTLHLLLLIQFVLEAIIDDESWLVDVEMRCCSR